MECLKSGIDIFLKRSIQTSIVNSHTFTYKSLALADNPTQLELNCSGHSDYYIYLNSVPLLLRIKLVKNGGSDLSSSESNKAGCVNKLLHSTFSSLSVSLNWKPVTLHETNYHYKAYHEKLLNYGSDTFGTHLVSSLWYLDSSEELKDNNCYSTPLKYIGNSQTLELYGRLRADLFNSDKTLINGVYMNIKPTRTPEAFYLSAPTNDTKVRTKILDATLSLKSN